MIRILKNGSRRFQHALSSSHTPRMDSYGRNEDKVFHYSIGRQHGYDFTVEELELLDRYEFNGNKRVHNNTYTSLPIEVIYSKLEEGRIRNHYVTAELFYVYIVVPLLQQDEVFVRSLKANQEFYIKRFVDFCGSEMMDIPDKKRQKMLDKLIEGLELNSITYGLPSNPPETSISSPEAISTSAELRNGKICLQLAKGCDFQRLKEVLKDIIVKYDDSEHVNMDMKVFFDIIYELSDVNAENKPERTEIIEFLLAHAPRQEGFFKLLSASLHRHIANQKFDVALILLKDSAKILHIHRNLNRDQFIKQNVGRLAKKLIHSTEDIDLAKEFGDKIYGIYQESFGYYDELLWTILLSNRWKNEPMKRVEMLKGIVDIVDEGRERIQLVYPILAGCTGHSNETKLNVLAEFLNLGYTEYDHVDVNILWINVIHPLLLEIHPENRKFFDEKPASALREKLKKRIEDGGIGTEFIDQLFQKIGLCIRSNFTLHDSNRYQRVFPEPRVTNTYKNIKFDQKTFSHLVFGGNCDKILNFLEKTNGFSKDLNMNKATDPLIQVFLKNGTMEQVDQLLLYLSLINTPTQNITDYGTCHSPVTSVHLLNVLTKKSTTTRDLDLVEYATKLKDLFPTIFDHKKQYRQTIGATRNLFQTLLSGDLSISEFDIAVELLVKLTKLSFVLLHENESITTFIINRALFTIGWTPAVATWLTLQNTRNLSNALFALLQYCIKTRNEDRFNFLLHHARTNLTETKINAYLSTAYAAQGRQQEAANVIKNGKIWTGEVLMALRLWMALHPMDTNVIRFIETMLVHTDILRWERLLKMMVEEVQRRLAYKMDMTVNREFQRLVKTYNLPVVPQASTS